MRLLIPKQNTNKMQGLSSSFSILPRLKSSLKNRHVCMVKFWEFIGGCVRKPNQTQSILSASNTTSSLNSQDSISFERFRQLDQSFSSLELIENLNSTLVVEEEPLQKFYDKMAYESLLEVLLTVVTSLFGIFDFACKIFDILWGIFKPVNNLTNLEGKNVLIVGAAGGVGASVSKQLAKLGSNIALWDIDEKHLNSLVNELQENGYKPISKIVDIRSAKQVNEAGEELSNEFEVDILFNTAGFCHLNDSSEDSDDRIERILDTNVKGYVWPIRFFWKQFLKKGKGHIVSMASVAGIAGVPHLCEYTGTLHGIVGYMDALEADTFGRGIHDIYFTVCNPPFIHTPMAHALNTTGNDKAKWAWVEADECARQVIRAISDRKRLHTYPWDAALFCSFKAILPRRRFNLLNGRWWPYETK